LEHYQSLLANFATKVTNNKNIEFTLTRMENILDILTIEKAIKQLDWPLFKIAIDTEIEAMKRTGSKWTLRIKRKANG